MLQVTGGHGVRYSYDRDGLVLSTANAATPAVPVLTLTRSALDGHVEQDVLGVVQTEYAVDVSAATPGYGDYQGSTVRVNGLPVYQSTYQHDALGRITEWAETVDGASRVQRFEYDDGGRLLNVRDELDAPVADYGYDLNGNRTHVVEPGRVLDLGVNLGCADSGGVPLARGANDRDELRRHGEHDYSYDANGRLQTRVNVSDPLDETVYTYDGGGRLHQVALGGTTVDYVHDALGRRVGRRLNGVFERGWLYKDSLNPIAQVDATGAVQATYVYVTRANVPDYIVAASGDVYRVVADHLGSVRMLVNTTTGAITERYDYDVWGRVTFESGDHSLHPFGYAGGLYDADTGLVRFGVRDYDADTGRWTAPEPLGFAAESNWYRYAGGDPVGAIDPNGQFVCGGLCIAAVAGLVGAGVAAWDAYSQAESHGGKWECVDYGRSAIAGVGTAAGILLGGVGTGVGYGILEAGLIQALTQGLTGAATQAAYEWRSGSSLREAIHSAAAALLVTGALGGTAGAAGQALARAAATRVLDAYAERALASQLSGLPMSVAAARALGASEASALAAATLDNAGAFGGVGAAVGSPGLIQWLASE